MSLIRTHFSQDIRLQTRFHILHPRPVNPSVLQVLERLVGLSDHEGPPIDLQPQSEALVVNTKSTELSIEVVSIDTNSLDDVCVD